ncbi:SDR family oxidoreductase [Algoriphagus sediminis]|uniref:dTDP-4-dehydrorhamnose reductase n=1 Tax=Algoriphagus sediminis TaxID=3057113 RepID=A0ABT7Y9A2_9BACT|nr:SDR family oxidoreductase [Algoriphagus sediminis]MDN3203089.1 SDR family oxidoreductase [Algoriphagus sediminis]
MNKKKILITGANGLLGQKLISQLVAGKEFDVLASGRGPCRIPGDGFDYVSMDITNKAEVIEVFETQKPEIVIHGAAMTQVDDCELHREACYEANVMATENLLVGAQGCNSHFIFVSTDFIFSGDKGPLTEDEEASPVNYYGETKLLAEEKVKASGLKWAIARTVLVYGISHDMSRSNIILWVKKSLEEGKSIKVVNDQWRTPTLAEDLAAGCILIAQKEAQGVYNISGEDFLTPYDMAMMTADYFHLDKSLITKADSSTFTQPAKRPPKTGFIIDKAKKELGYQPKSFRTGIDILAKQIILARS